MPQDSLTLHHRRYHASDSGLPSLSSTYTLDPARSSPMLAAKDQDRHDSKQSTGTVQIIGRPEEAFTRVPERVHREKKRETISTWGF